MTDHGRPSVYAKEPGMMMYFKDTFAQDSAFPLSADQDPVAFVVGEMVCLIPPSSIDQLPCEVGEPPVEAVPDSHRHLLDDVDGVDTFGTNSTTPESPADGDGRRRDSSDAGAASVDDAVPDHD